MASSISPAPSTGRLSGSRASNTGAVRFYQWHGFVVVGGTDGDNEEGAPDLRMSNLTAGPGR